MLGANRGVMANLDAPLPAAALRSDAQLVQRSLVGLIGGHPENNIREKRMSSIRGFASLLMPCSPLPAASSLE